MYASRCATSAIAKKIRDPSMTCLCSSSDSGRVRPVGQTRFGSSDDMSITPSNMRATPARGLTVAAHRRRRKQERSRYRQRAKRRGSTPLVDCSSMHKKPNPCGLPGSSHGKNVKASCQTRMSGLIDICDAHATASQAAAREVVAATNAVTALPGVVAGNGRSQLQAATAKQGGDARRGKPARKRTPPRGQSGPGAVCQQRDREGSDAGVRKRRRWPVSGRAASAGRTSTRTARRYATARAHRRDTTRNS